jgi:hypothetical protein
MGQIFMPTSSVDTTVCILLGSLAVSQGISEFPLIHFSAFGQIALAVKLVILPIPCVKRLFKCASAEAVSASLAVLAFVPVFVGFADAFNKKVLIKLA